MLGGLAASGWHTAAMGMRLAYDGYVKDIDSWGGPGIEELKWLLPVRPGDTLGLRRQILGKRVSKSRPEMGFVDTQLELFNQRRETVMTQRMFMMVGLRGAARAPMAEPVAKAAATPASAPAPDMPDRPLWFDDIALDTRRPIGPFHFTAENIIRFAERYDPQPFHLSEEGAAKSHFGRLAASGWHTGAVWMKLMIADRDRRDAGFRARGLELPPPGPSPGFRNLRWIAPVHAGDTITYDSIISDKRASASRPGWGLVFFKNSGVNQRGAKVFSFDGSSFWARREGA